MALFIPVFTVYWGDRILKTIFLVTNPRRIVQNVEQTMYLGSDSRCMIRVTDHPSVSEFHLQIQSDCYARSVFITDKATMHGTFISGERIKPKVRRRLNDGDTLHLGSSSRLYKLDWVSVNCAFGDNGIFLFELPGSIRIVKGAADQDTKVRDEWTMVPDTLCLLAGNSRQMLKKLRGTPRTTLVIPRIVVSELDRMINAGDTSLRTEASAALDWITECMRDTRWWIHFQNPEEEVKITGDNRDYTFSIDPILECALFLKNTTDHVVILSDYSTLKIHAMAQGVNCETAEEFWSSLNNPFSARFMYPGSVPVGPRTSYVMADTWFKDHYQHGNPWKTTASKLKHQCSSMYFDFCFLRSFNVLNLGIIF